MRKTELKKRMLHYFRTAGTADSGFTEDLPSFVRFAHREGIEMRALRTLCEKDRAFARVYEECEEILTDRIIDGALHKRLDASFSKFLLAARFGLSEKKAETEDGTFDLEIVLKEPPTRKGDDEDQ